jgi:hypothetical protein
MAFATCNDSEHGQLTKVVLTEQRPCNKQHLPYCAFKIMALTKYNATNYNTQFYMKLLEVMQNI